MFPEYLNKGSKGGAVALLQVGLLMGGFSSRIVVDGDYGEETAIGVKVLQAHIGFAGNDVDGNFGPATRQRLLEKRGININALQLAMFTEPTVAAAV